MKKFILVNGKRMCVNTFGMGCIPVVILHGMGSKDPLGSFDSLVKKFISDSLFRVVLIEYFGCGSSDDVDIERSNYNIISEVRFALKTLGVEIPRIVIPHSISGLYSLYYANNYPDEIFAVVGVDISTPRLFLEYFTGENYKKYSLDEVKDLGITVAHLNEWNNIIGNARELINFKWPKNLIVTSFVSSYNVSEMEKTVNMNLVKMSEDIISNPEIQHVKILEGNHWLQINQYDKIYRETKKISLRYKQQIKLG